MSSGPRRVVACAVLSGMLALSLLGVVSSGASVEAGGKVVSARLTKTSFTAAQARTVKLKCRFSPATKRAVFLLQKKKGSKWVKVRSTTKSGSIKAYTTTVKKLFGSKAVRVAQYRVKVSADANSVSRFFRIKRKAGVGDPDTSTAPNAGLWSNEKIGSDNGVRFYVEPTRKNVLRFDYWYHYSGETAACTGDSAVGTPATGALSMIPVHPDGSFFYSALTSTAGSSFTISGIFDSPTSAHGTAR